MDYRGGVEEERTQEKVLVFQGVSVLHSHLLDVVDALHGVGMRREHVGETAGLFTAVVRCVQFFQRMVHGVGEHRGGGS